MNSSHILSVGFIAICIMWLLVFIFDDPTSTTYIANNSIINLTCPEPICNCEAPIIEPTEYIVIHRRSNGSENQVTGIAFEGIGYFVKETKNADRTELHEQLHLAVWQDKEYWCGRYNLGEHWCK